MSAKMYLNGKIAVDFHIGKGTKIKIILTREG